MRMTTMIFWRPMIILTRPAYVVNDSSWKSYLGKQHKNWVVGTMHPRVVWTRAISYARLGTKHCWIPILCFRPTCPTRALYHCPADNYVDPYAGNQIHVRSYSMNSAVGTIFYDATAATPIGSPVGGEFLPGTWTTGQTTWQTYGKMSSFKQPGPSETWVFIDENPRTINDSSFCVAAVATPGNTYLIDKPSGLHGKAGGISFADGHSTVHQWLDPRTYTVTINGQGNAVQTSTQQSPDDPDCFYLAPLTSALR